MKHTKFYKNIPCIVRSCLVLLLMVISMPSIGVTAQQVKSKSTEQSQHKLKNTLKGTWILKNSPLETTLVFSDSMWTVTQDTVFLGDIEVYGFYEVIDSKTIELEYADDDKKMRVSISFSNDSRTIKITGDKDCDFITGEWQYYSK